MRGLWLKIVVIFPVAWTRGEILFLVEKVYLLSRFRHADLRMLSQKGVERRSSTFLGSADDEIDSHFLAPRDWHRFAQLWKELKKETSSLQTPALRSDESSSGSCLKNCCSSL